MTVARQYTRDVGATLSRPGGCYRADWISDAGGDKPRPYGRAGKGVGATLVVARAGVPHVARLRSRVRPYSRYTRAAVL